MIRKNDEMGKGDKKVSSFKKFSEMNKEFSVGKIDPTKTYSECEDDCEDKLPCNPNLPVNSDRKEVFMDTTPPKEELPKNEVENTNESKDVKYYGKVARFKKNTKASNAYNFLESVKISKSTIWYIMVEKDNELQMVKYNYKQGVDLNKFVNELKSYYISKNSGNKLFCESISKITVDGNDKYSMIRNIPQVKIDEKNIITKITEDLIKLLSK